MITKLSYPVKVSNPKLSTGAFTVDTDGNIFIVDAPNKAVYKIDDLKGQNITDCRMKQSKSGSYYNINSLAMVLVNNVMYRLSWGDICSLKYIPTKYTMSETGTDFKFVKSEYEDFHVDKVCIMNMDTTSIWGWTYDIQALTNVVLNANVAWDPDMQILRDPSYNKITFAGTFDSNGNIIGYALKKAAIDSVSANTLDVTKITFTGNGWFRIGSNFYSSYYRYPVKFTDPKIADIPAKDLIVYDDAAVLYVLYRFNGAWYSASGSINESAATTGTAFTKWKNESDLLYVGTTFDANGRYARMVYRHLVWQTNDGVVYINNMYTTPFTVTGMGTIKDVKCVNGAYFFEDVSGKFFEYINITCAAPVGKISINSRIEFTEEDFNSIGYDTVRQSTTDMGVYLYYSFITSSGNTIILDPKLTMLKAIELPVKHDPYRLAAHLIISNLFTMHKQA